MKLRSLQSIVGLLNFIARAIPAGRAFNRRFYDALSHAKKAHLRIRISNGLKDDARVWIRFLREFNGTCLFNEADWLHSDVMELFTNANGNKDLGCGCYFHGEWAFFPWPVTFGIALLKNVTFLELVPIILSLHLWGAKLRNKKINFRSDNKDLVEIINKKTSKNKSVMYLIRHLVLLTLELNIMVKCTHIDGIKNEIADAISRFQWDRLLLLLPANASRTPLDIPESFPQILNPKLIN